MIIYPLLEIIKIFRFFHLKTLIEKCFETTKITPEDEFNSLPDKNLLAKEIKDKLKAISMYKHELRKFPHPRSKEVIDATATRWGGLYGYSRAEAFEIVSSRATDLSKLSLFTKT